MNAGNVQEIYNILLQIERKKDYLTKYETKLSLEPDSWFKKYKDDIKDLYTDILNIVKKEDELNLIKKSFEKLSENQIKKRKSSLLLAEYRKLKPKKNSTNEKIIRKNVIDFLKKEYLNSVIKEEFTHTFLNVRTDILSIGNNKITGEEVIISVEIKSDKDTFDRLYKQLTEYKNFSNIIYVAIDEKHLKKYEEKYSNIFNHIGILVFSEEILIEYKKPRILEFPFLYNLIWNSEKLEFFKNFKGRSKIPSKSDKVLDWVIKSIFSYNEIEKISKSIFFDRIKKNNKNVSVNMENFININKKQILFNEILKDKYWKNFKYGKPNYDITFDN